MVNYVGDNLPLQYSSGEPTFCPSSRHWGRGPVGGF